jgi:CubicO group peptidase (beta-lactamase class C family)
MIVPLLLLLSAQAAAVAQPAYPAAQKMDAVIEEAVRAGRIPGAVVWIGQPGKVLFRKAYGDRALEPVREPMTLDTVFDAASLTKVMATSASFMKLVEEGKVRLNDPVTSYLPSFQGGKSAITIRHLLTHFSGLRPDVDLKPAWSGYETGVNLALIDKPVAEPGARFIYSDINFILLGEIVRVVSGKPLDAYAKEAIFDPLGMKETGYRPAIPPMYRVVGSCTTPRSSWPSTRSVGAMRASSDSAGRYPVSFIPSGSKIASFA